MDTPIPIGAGIPDKIIQFLTVRVENCYLKRDCQSRFRVPLTPLL